MDGRAAPEPHFFKALAEDSVTADDTFSFLQGGGRAAELVRNMDWASTPLGALHTWPISLRTTVASILSSAFPAAIGWGPELITIYNDPFRPILGQKPEAMGRPPRKDDHGGEVYVYRRTGLPCLVCGTEVRTQVLAARNLFWCPRCQH